MMRSTFSDGSAQIIFFFLNSGLLVRILLSFSVYTNASKLLSTNQPPGTLSAVNGIRFVSMTWVILGHTYFFGASLGGEFCIGFHYTEIYSTIYSHLFFTVEETCS